MSPEIHRPARRIRASYDAAGSGVDFAQYWANADTLDADSAHSRAVRATLVKRSRYEVGNNGFSDGIVQTHANFLVGKGPNLQIQTADEQFNLLVQKRWNKWAKRCQLRRKLWCLAHAKVQDGESFAIVTNNPRLNHKVKIDLKLLETEQCQTPLLPYDVEGYIDGIQFDEFHNPLFYDILPYHPGGSVSSLLARNWGQPAKIPARFVLHWFMLRRPGQHRGVPELKSTLHVGAASRRWREATIAAAETAAELGAAVLKTNANPGEADKVAPMSTVQLEKNMFTVLPEGWDVQQMEGKHPNATYDSFHKSQINALGRPKNMPLNIGKCDSSGYNFASGRLDHGTYFLSIDVEREDGNDCVLDPLFALWYQEASLVYGWPTQFDEDDEPPHSWGWPQHPEADRLTKAQSDDARLKNGTATPSMIASEEGRDFEALVQAGARDYGIPVAEFRAKLLNANLNAQNQQASMLQSRAAVAQATGTDMGGANA